MLCYKTRAFAAAVLLAGPALVLFAKNSNAAPRADQTLPAPLLLYANGAPGATGAADEYKPALYPVLPTPEKNTGAAILVCPGGGLTTLLTSYLKSLAENDPGKFKKFDEPGPSVPPQLLWQGSRTQPDWLFQFLLNPTKIREMTVLRMPKFNMSTDEARALVDYFAAVEQRVNPRRRRRRRRKRPRCLQRRD